MSRRGSSFITFVWAILTLSTGCTYIHDSRSSSVIEVGEVENADLVDGVATLRHTSWHHLLEGYASDRGVAYDELLAEGEQRFLLRQYLLLLGAVDPRGLVDRDEKIAFYVNLYNATVVDWVLRRLEESPDFRVDQGGFEFFDEPTVNVDGRLLSLNVLEHALLRGDFGHGSASVSAVDGAIRSDLEALHEGIWEGEPFDPRVHFLLNCASASCPPIQSSALRGDDVRVALDDATAAFLDDVQRGAGPSGISRLFDWFVQDFATAGWATPSEFIETYRDLDDVDVTTFLPYDWALNHWRRP